MSHERGKFYLRPNSSTRVPLGDDFAQAMAKYGALVAGHWSGRTLGDVIDRYAAEVLPLKAANTRAHEQPGLDRLKRVFGRLLPDQLTPQDCYRYIDLRRTKTGEPAPIAARHEVALLRHIFTKAIRWGITSANPVRGVELPVAKRGKRYVTDEELDAVKVLASPSVRVAINLAHLTGARRGTVLALTRDDELDEGLRVFATKTGKSDVFEWTPALRLAVEEAHALKPQVPGFYLVRNRAGKQYTGSGFAALWKALMRRHVKAGGSPFTFQDIRRKTGSDSDTLAEATARLQHSSEATTRAHYRVRRALLKPLK